MQQDRTPGGKFAAGNKLSRGNPHCDRIAKLRSAMLAAVTEKNMKSVVKKLVELAEGGDVKAIQLLLDRTLGKIDATIIAPSQDDASTARPSALDIVDRIRARRLHEAGLPSADDGGKDRLLAIAERIRAQRQAVADQSELNCVDAGREDVTLDISSKATP